VTWSGEDHCPIHGLVVHVQSSPMCKPHCELCLIEELRKREAIMKKPTHDYVPVGIAEQRPMGVPCVCNYRGFWVESYITESEPWDSTRAWLTKNDAFRRLFEAVISNDSMSIEKFELQDGWVIVHRRGGGTFMYKLEPIEEKQDDVEPPLP